MRPLVARGVRVLTALISVPLTMHYLEAERYGVRVSALCPTAIDTPILDSEGPADLPRPWRPNLRQYLTRIGGAPMPVEAFADYALAGIAANRAQIVAPASARISAWLYRVAPSLVRGRIKGALGAELAEREPNASR